MIYIFTFFGFVLFLYFIRLYFINLNLKKQEAQIVSLFNQRVNMIPALYEVTKSYFNKHNEIFEEILKLRKQELYKFYIQEYTDNIENEFLKLVHLEEKIHREFNFIFKVSNIHQKLQKQWNFIYLRDLIINKSLEIWENFANYKMKVKLYNKLVFFEIYKKIEL